MLSPLSEDSENLIFEFMPLPTRNKHIFPGKGNEKVKFLLGALEVLVDNVMYHMLE